MKTGNRWLMAGLTGALLLVPGLAQAQTPGVDTPVAPTPGGGRSAGPAGSFQPPAPIRPGAPISVLVFPFGLPEDAASDMAPPPAEPGAAAEPPAGLSSAQQDALGYLTAQVKAGLLSSPYYTVATYHPQSSLIQRGRRDDILRPEHVTDLISPATGAVNADKARTVAHRLGMQAVMLGTVETKEDPKTNTVELTLETQIVDSTTGQVLRSAAVTGAAAGAEGVPIIAVRERAAQDAAQKALPALGIQLVPLPTTEAPAKNGKKTEAQKKAERDARKAERLEKEQAAKAEKERKRQEEKARREAEKAQRARRDAEQRGAASRVAGTRVASNGTVRLAQAQPATPPAAEAPETVTAPNTVPGYTNATGQPVPYGYAIGEATEAVPEERKNKLRIPSWLGLAGFLTALSILL